MEVSIWNCVETLWNFFYVN